MGVRLISVAIKKKQLLRGSWTLPNDSKHMATQIKLIVSQARLHRIFNPFFSASWYTFSGKGRHVHM
jgi:hypothetical protein